MIEDKKLIQAISEIMEFFTDYIFELKHHSENEIQSEVKCLVPLRNLSRTEAHDYFSNKLKQEILADCAKLPDGKITVSFTQEGIDCNEGMDKWRYIVRSEPHDVSYHTEGVCKITDAFTKWAKENISNFRNWNKVDPYYSHELAFVAGMRFLKDNPNALD